MNLSAWHKVGAQKYLIVDDWVIKEMGSLTLRTIVWGRRLANRHKLVRSMF